ADAATARCPRHGARRSGEGSRRVARGDSEADAGSRRGLSPRLGIRLERRARALGISPADPARGTETDAGMAGGERHMAGLTRGELVRKSVHMSVGLIAFAVR